MSDFDKFFAERLNEDSEFPLREKNWKALSRRLDVAGVGALATAVAVLKYWKLASLGVALVSGLLIWNVVSLQRENKKLREQLEQRQINMQPAAVMPGDLVPSDHQPGGVPNLSSDGAKAVVPTTEPARISWSKPSGKANQISQKNNPASLRSPSAAPAVGTPVAEQLSKQTPAAEMTDHPSGLSAIPSKSAAAETEVAVGSVKTESEPGADRSADVPINPVTESVISPEKTPAPTALVDPLPQIPPILLPNAASKPQAPVMAPFSITRPYREKAGRFRLGVQGLFASANPTPEGISALTGAGFLAEYSPVRNFWASVSADWLSYDVKTTEYLPPSFFHAPQPKVVKPPPGGHQHPLLEVTGHQRMQLYTVGLRYVLPLRFWLRPSVQVGYAWARKSPEVYSYVFEEDQHGGPGPQPPKPPIYIAASLAGQNISGLWRMGVAAEHETNDWVFRAGVDWLENSAASKPLFDAALVQASVLYKF
ncbi:MAG: hypothetical protein ACKVU2_14345 [Saprospiraceae bacterium]